MSIHKFHVGDRVRVQPDVNFWAGKRGRVDEIDGLGRFRVRFDGHMYATGPFGTRELEKEDGDDGAVHQ